MKEDILLMINEGTLDIVTLHEFITQMNTVDIADAFEHLNKEKAVQIFRLLPKNMAAEVFAYIVPKQQQTIVEALTDREIGRIMDELFMDDAVDFIEEMPANVVKRVLQNTTFEKRQLINHLLQYPEDSAGSIMTTEYVELHENATVSGAFDSIRATGVNKETIYTCYVTMPDKVLTGMVTAETLMLADPVDRIGDIMEGNPLFVYTTDDQEQLAGLFKKYGLLSLPVVDKEQRLVGIVTVDDIFEIIEEETTEDFEKMAALSPSNEPYLHTGVLQLAKNCFFWLLFLMLSATITGIIISSFEDALAYLPALVAFIPMLMGTGGNAGSQASTMIIRGMALGEITPGDVLRIMWLELRIGMICGLGLGMVNFLRIYLTNDKNAMLSLSVTLSLLVTIILAKTVGSLLPLLAQKVRLDPALMAAPLISTIVDGASLVVYFSIARIIFGL